MAFIEIDKLRKSFSRRGGDTDRLDVLDIDQLSLERGRQYVIVGPSGSGKTTFLNLIAGLLRPDSGRLVVDDTDLGELSEARLDRFRGKKIGYIFQNFNLLAPFTVLENVLLGMTFCPQLARSKRKPRALELLARVRLDHRLNHRPDELSVGEQQRVCIARALANSPELLLADEPTGNLDVPTGERIIQLIQEICREGNHTLLLVTHDPRLMERFPDTLDIERFRPASAKDGERHGKV